MKLKEGYHFLIIFLRPFIVCNYGTGKTGRTSSLGLHCGTGNGWNWLWNRGGPRKESEILVFICVKLRQEVADKSCEMSDHGNASA